MELEYLVQCGYQAVFFDDATFTVNKRRTSELLAAIRAAGVGMSFACQTRADCVDPWLLEDMAASGFSFVSFGLETTDEEALKSMQKSKRAGTHAATSIAAVEACKKNGILSCLNLITGFEGETSAKAASTFSFAATVEPDFVSVSALALYPHQDPTTAEIYEGEVSTEDVWKHFDEGYGAIHPYLTSDEAEQRLQAARSILGARLDVV
jgi:radical SAM superfamily enzyme YgiQ (UPF0313 family)